MRNKKHDPSYLPRAPPKKTLIESTSDGQPLLKETLAVIFLFTPLDAQDAKVFLMQTFMSNKAGWYGTTHHTQSALLLLSGAGDRGSNFAADSIMPSKRK